MNAMLVQGGKLITEDELRVMMLDQIKKDGLMGRPSNTTTSDPIIAKTEDPSQGGDGPRKDPEAQARREKARALRRQGLSFAQIGYRLGVSKQTVNRYLNDSTWRSIGDEAKGLIE